MNIDSAARKIWDYMLMHHDLKKTDVILVLGNTDTRVAEYAAKLYLDGWAPLMVCTGSGSIHNHKPERKQFVNTTEAEVFAGIAIKMGVPKEAIIVENKSQTTIENYQFTIEKFKERNISPKRIIIVQKPYMERRAYAVGKIFFPDIELIVTSFPTSFEKYPNEVLDKDKLIHAMVGDLQRIREYPKEGFQLEQDIPQEVWEAYEYLVSKGYTERLIKRGESQVV